MVAVEYYTPKVSAFDDSGMKNQLEKKKKNQVALLYYNYKSCIQMFFLLRTIQEEWPSKI